MAAVDFQLEYSGAGIHFPDGIAVVAARCHSRFIFVFVKIRYLN